jgi:chemotaxis protein MotA
MKHATPWWQHHSGPLSVVVVLSLALGLSPLPLASWAHPTGWLLVFGGTLAAVLLSYGPGDVADCWQRLCQTVTQRIAGLQHLGYRLAQQARQVGLLTLERELPQWAQHPDTSLLAEGLALVMDNLPIASVDERLSVALETQYQAQLEQAQLLEAAAGYAPTMGLLGALLGLMATLSQPISALAVASTGVAQAFSATLLGVALANLVLQPLAHRMRRQAKQHGLVNSVQRHLVLALARGEHPTLLREQLQQYLPQHLPLADTASPVQPEAQASVTLSPLQPLASSLGGVSDRVSRYGLKRPLPSAGAASPKRPAKARAVNPSQAAYLP